MLHLKVARADQSRRPYTCVRVCSIVSDPRDCSLPDSSVHGILQTKVLECIAVPFSRGSSPPRDPTSVSGVPCFGRQVLYHYATWEALKGTDRIQTVWDPDRIGQSHDGAGLN